MCLLGVSFGRYLGKCLPDCFHIAHAHPLRGVDVSFWSYDLLTKFLTFDFLAILTLIN